MPFDGTDFAQRDLMLERINGVINLLRSEDRWCKGQLKTSDGKRCIMGAVMAVDAEQLLARPILEAIREVTGRSFARIERFNDHSRTDHRLVVAVLEKTRENIAIGRTAAPPSRCTVTHRVRMFYAAVATLRG